MRTSSFLNRQSIYDTIKQDISEGYTFERMWKIDGKFTNYLRTLGTLVDSRLSKLVGDKDIIMSVGQGMLVTLHRKTKNETWVRFRANAKGVGVFSLRNILDGLEIQSSLYGKEFMKINENLNQVIKEFAEHQEETLTEKDDFMIEIPSVARKKIARIADMQQVGLISDKDADTAIKKIIKDYSKNKVKVEAVDYGMSKEDLEKLKEVLGSIVEALDPFMKDIRNGVFETEAYEETIKEGFSDNPLSPMEIRKLKHFVSRKMEEMNYPYKEFKEELIRDFIRKPALSRGLLAHFS